MGPPSSLTSCCKQLVYMECGDESCDEQQLVHMECSAESRDEQQLNVVMKATVLRSSGAILLECSLMSPILHHGQLDQPSARW